MPAAKSQFENDMEQHEEEWSDAMDQQRSQEVLPAGVYQARVAAMRVEQTGWDDTWELFIRFEDLNGAGAVSVWDNLESEIGRSIAASHVKALGYEGNLGKLDTACASGSFDDLVVEIRVKDNVKEDKTYKAVYVNRLFGKLEDGVAPTTPAGVRDSDDIPF